MLWPDARVCDLLDTHSGGWKMDLLSVLFLSHEIQHIQAIPRSPWGFKDELVWYYNKNGCFDVRSTYHLSRSLQNLEEGGEGASSNSKEKSFWVKIWNLSISPKVKVFVWRACSGILPTGQNLSARLRMGIASCRWCGCDSETHRHIFFECGFAQEVWLAMGMLKAVCKLAVPNYKDWLDCFLKLKGKETAALVAVTMWMIWRCRNQKVFEGKNWDATQVAEFAKAFLHEFWSIHNMKGTRRNIEYRRWVAPAEHHLKLNVDGAFSDGAAGVGVVVRNHLGQVEAVMATRVTGVLHAEYVECLAFLSALEFARDFGITHFLLGGDALNIVEKINSKEPDLSLIGNLVHGIRALMTTFDFVNVNYVRRTNNVPAHIVSKMSLSLEGSKVWFVDFPNAVTNAALQDLA